MWRHSLVQTFSYKRPPNIRDSEKIWLLLNQSDTLGLYSNCGSRLNPHFLFLIAFIHANTQKLKHDRLTHPNHPFRKSLQVQHREHETNEYVNSPRAPKLMILVGGQKKAPQESPHQTLPEEGGPSATSLGHLGHRRRRDFCVVLQQIWRATMGYSACLACPAKWGSNWRGASDAKQPLVCLHSQTYPSFFFLQFACPWTSLLPTLSQ